MADTYELNLIDRMAALSVILKALMLQRHLVKYNPNQPRAPAGRPDGGQWVDSHSSSRLAGPFNELNRAKCEAQYQGDEFQCTFVASARSRQACLEQARSIYIVHEAPADSKSHLLLGIDDMIIATRKLIVMTKSGREADVAVRLFLPTGAGVRWECRYEMDFPEDGWPAQTVKGYAVGSDTLHALQLAMQKLGVELHMTSYHSDKTMHWGHWDGYGIALPKEGRDLMRGDDAKFFG